jgi:hypothetical protein
MRYIVVLSLFFVLAACSSDSNDDNGGGNDPGLESILNGSQATYTEQNEEQNNDPAFAEDPGYTLDTNGIELRGVLALNSANIAGDKYLVYSGSATHIDLQVFLSGVGLQNDAPQITTRFDALDPDGVSALVSNSFRHIPVIADTFYVISISVPTADQSALNQSYKIEIKASN